MKHFFVDWLIYPDHPRRTKAMHIAFLVLYFLFMVAGPFITISIEYGWWNRTPSAGGVGGPVVVTLAFMLLTTLILATKKIKKISENDYKTRRIKHICLMLQVLCLCRGTTAYKRSSGGFFRKNRAWWHRCLI